MFGRRSRLLAGASTVMLLGASAAALASGGARTRVVYVAPVDSTGAPRPGLVVTRHANGRCSPGSDSVPGPVYRCFFGNFVIDPCWAESTHPGAVLCMPIPWSRKVVELTAAGLEPSSEPVPRTLSYPWGVELTNGEQCLAAQGAHALYHGRVVDYGCGGHHRVVLLRGMHRKRQPWSFDSATWTGHGYAPGKRRNVRVAWYGGPAPA